MASFVGFIRARQFILKLYLHCNFILMTFHLRNRQLTATTRRGDLDFLELTLQQGLKRGMELMKVGRKVLKMSSMEQVKVKKVASSSVASVGNLSELVTICAHQKSV